MGKQAQAASSPRHKFLQKEQATSIPSSMQSSPLAK